MKHTDLPAEQEYTGEPSKIDRILQALRSLGGFASGRQVMYQAGYGYQARLENVSGPIVSIEGGWLLLEGLVRCPTCGYDWPEAPKRRESCKQSG